MNENLTKNINTIPGQLKSNNTGSLIGFESKLILAQSSLTNLIRIFSFLMNQLID